MIYDIKVNLSRYMSIFVYFPPHPISWSINRNSIEIWSGPCYAHGLQMRHKQYIIKLYYSLNNTWSIWVCKYGVIIVTIARVPTYNNKLVRYSSVLLEYQRSWCNKLDLILKMSVYHSYQIHDATKHCQITP